MSPVEATLAVVVVALGWTLWIGVCRRDPAIVVNAVAALVVVAIPGGVGLLAPVGLDTRVSVWPLLSIVIGITGIFHMIGMVGWYDTVWWWDHLTHTVSAALIASVVYAWMLVISVDTVYGPFGSPAVATVGVTLFMGIIWELFEGAARVLCERLGIERVLKQYGRFDTPLDIVFDGVGAILVVVADCRLLVPLFESIPQLTCFLFYGWLLFLVVGSFVPTVIMIYGRLAR